MNGFHYNQSSGGGAIFHATTVIAVRRNGVVAMAGDGQVTFNNTVLKANAKKVRRMYEQKVLAGFAGAASDAFTLFEMFEKKLEQYTGSLKRAAYELAKEWRQDKYLRRLEAMLLVADLCDIYLINGAGDIVEPDYDALAIGSGAVMAYSSALALLENSGLGAPEIASKSLEIASRICVFTNSRITVETLEKSE